MLSSKFRICSPPMIYQILDGEVVILNLEEGIYYSLNDIAATIWQMIEEKLSIDEITKEISSAYLGERIKEEIERFFSELQKEGIICPLEIEHTETRMLPKQDLLCCSEKRNFEIPLLNKYSDMKELLLLDPIHEVDQTGWPHNKVE